MLFYPRESDMVEKALDVPFQDPGGGIFLTQHLEALLNGIRTPALGPKPVGVAIRQGLGDWLQCLEIDGLSCPVFHDWNRQRALLAVFLGQVNPFQRLWLVSPPPPNPCHCLSFLLGTVPEV